MSRYPEIEKWALGGHSLGGVMACRYARASAAKISGLILLASYPSHRFRVDDMTLKALSVFGTRDGLTKLSDIEASKQHLPAGTQFVEIQGGNHSQFCSLSKKDALVSRRQSGVNSVREAAAGDTASYHRFPWESLNLN